MKLHCNLISQLHFILYTLYTIQRKIFQYIIRLNQINGKHILSVKKALKLIENLQNLLMRDHIKTVMTITVMYTINDRNTRIVNSKVKFTKHTTTFGT